MSKTEQIAFLSLVEKYLDGRASAQEEALLNAYYDLFDDGPDALARIDAKDLQAVELRLKTKIDRSIGQQEKQTLKLSLYKYIAVAAAVIGIAVCVYLFVGPNAIDRNTIAAAEDIAPGTNGATLTLANGKQIKLTNVVNGELAKQSGVVITKTTDGKLLYEVKELNDKTEQTNTLSTANGETYQVRLPDGSLIWLNSASSLTYPANFTALKERRVRLSGEAYFEVAKDAKRPFRVESGGQDVEVLGTHFNVEAYADETRVRTTLLEGSVRINNELTIKPGEQVVSAGGQLKVLEVDAESYVFWKDGIFNFEQESLRSVMLKISRWYNVEVAFEPGVDDRKTFSGTVSKFGKISTILEFLQRSEGIQFKIEGKKVIVLKQ